MPSKNWTLSDDQTLAEYASLDDFTGLSQNRIGISPDHVALLMRDGEIVDTFTGAHFAVGGLWQRFKDLIGGPHTVRLLVADLKPFQIEGDIETLSKDDVTIVAKVAVEFQVNPEKPANILGLMKERGALTKPDIYNRLIPHLKDRVFSTALRKVNAAEIRGNNALQDKIQADILLEVERVFRDLGVIVRAVSLDFGVNDEEKAAMQRSASEREQRMLDYEFERKKRELTREKDSTLFQLSADLELEKKKATTEDELKHLFLDQELKFVDARQEAIRKKDLENLGHELRLLNTQRHAAYEKALEDAKNEVERAEARKKLRLVEREIQLIDLDIDRAVTVQKLDLDRLAAIQTIDLETEKRRRDQELAERMQAAQTKSIRDLGEIDRANQAAALDGILKTKETDAQSEVNILAVKQKMSAEQLLALVAGQSPEVARIFIERAKAEALAPEKQEAVLRELVQNTEKAAIRSDEQFRYFVEKAMQGVQGVAYGAGGRSAPGRPEEAKGDDPATDAVKVECPNCHRQIPSIDRFCRYCQHQMRT
jgi:hypothetical protein